MESLTEEELKEEIELVRATDNKTELYQLIFTCPKLYLSIFEHSPELQTQYQLFVTHIEGHLAIRFQLEEQGRWWKVAFMDEANTEQETIDEFKRLVAVAQDYTERQAIQRRNQLFEQTSMPKIKSSSDSDQDKVLTSADQIRKLVKQLSQYSGIDRTQILTIYQQINQLIEQHDPVSICINLCSETET